MRLAVPERANLGKASKEPDRSWGWRGEADSWDHRAPVLHSRGSPVCPPGRRAPPNSSLYSGPHPAHCLSWSHPILLFATRDYPTPYRPVPVLTRLITETESRVLPPPANISWVLSCARPCSRSWKLGREQSWAPPSPIPREAKNIPDHPQLGGGNWRPGPQQS